jgi:phosphate transport system ATP-binding protein
VTIDPMHTWSRTEARSREYEVASFPGAAVVQVVTGDPSDPDAAVVELHGAHVVITDRRVVATDGGVEWAWEISDIEEVVHGAEASWTILIEPGVSDFGVMVPTGSVETFRRTLDSIGGLRIRHQRTARPTVTWSEHSSVTAQIPVIDERSTFAPPSPAPQPPTPPVVAPPPLDTTDADADVVWSAPHRVGPSPGAAPAAPVVAVAPPVQSEQGTPKRDPQGPRPEAPRTRFGLRSRPIASTMADVVPVGISLAGIDARNISAWFGSHQVLDRVSLTMAAGQVTALIGPSGCGKSTFLRILNRMHEMIPGAAMGGEVLVDGHDIYDPARKLTDARREVGMVFQKPNPFPAMSIYDNVLASFRLTGVKATTQLKDEIVESCLTKAGLWNEVKDRLRQPGGGLSGGQQQRLCIARALGIRPRVLLMDEPCSALDPTSTRRIEETIMQLVTEVTIVIVTHNMQQAARVSNQCAFFLAEQGTPGVIVEHGATDAMFGQPQDPRTADYVMGRFG